MGYRVQPTVYRLKFHDEAFSGLEVDIRSMTVREWERLVAPDPPADPDDEALPAGQRGARREAARKEALARARANRELLAGRIVSWNLEDDEGNALPPTAETLETLERPFVLELMAAWQLALIGVDPTSDGGSSSGATPPEMEMPQEPITADALEAMTTSPGRRGPMT